MNEQSTIRLAPWTGHINLTDSSGKKAPRMLHRDHNPAAGLLFTVLLVFDVCIWLRVLLLLLLHK